MLSLLEGQYGTIVRRRAPNVSRDSRLPKAFSFPIRGVEYEET